VCYCHHLDQTRIEQAPGDVLRGGSWNNNQNNARAAYRNNNNPHERNNNNGFRVCCRPCSSAPSSGVRWTHRRGGRTPMCAPVPTMIGGHGFRFEAKEEE
jgi:hypothetical protein